MSERIRVLLVDDDPEVIVLTTFEADDYVLRAGAGGFVLKDTPPAEIIRAVRTVAAGEPIPSPTITRRLIGHVTDSESAGATPASGWTALSDTRTITLRPWAQRRWWRSWRERCCWRLWPPALW